jgi:hypothetical protein
MDKNHKPSNSGCYTPSSEQFRFYRKKICPNNLVPFFLGTPTLRTYPAMFRWSNRRDSTWDHHLWSSAGTSTWLQQTRPQGWCKKLCRKVRSLLKHTKPVCVKIISISISAIIINYNSLVSHSQVQRSQEFCGTVRLASTIKLTAACYGLNV